MSQTDRDIKPPLYLPGELSPAEERRRMVRVDQAGEYGAVRIYEGQMAVLGATASGAVVERMKEQEERHLEKFNDLMTRRRVRPTALQPLWHMAGFALGAATALMGEKAAMACTVAVEETIDEHYRAQAEKLGEGKDRSEDDRELHDLIEECRADELAHKEEAEGLGARETPGYSLLSDTIKRGSRLAIWLSQRI
ncbi:MAG: demethoxyubiquinone hydroxylase family protein [Alphaproteobacteria bacterium]|nr:demethoxyubiquinone hydroxylase family protein [Alphaproteobacteria bacterium]